MNKIEKSFARTFSCSAGEVVMKHLRKMTIERVLGANATEPELRTLEGQRALVRQIEQLIERGKSDVNT